ncbi:unnamed protein product, partial [marine sediment metagenome]
ELTLRKKHVPGGKYSQMVRLRSTYGWRNSTGLIR